MGEIKRHDFTPCLIYYEPSNKIFDIYTMCSLRGTKDILYIWLPLDSNDSCTFDMIYAFMTPTWAHEGSCHQVQVFTHRWNEDSCLGTFWSHHPCLILGRIIPRLAQRISTPVNQQLVSSPKRRPRPFFANPAYITKRLKSYLDWKHSKKILRISNPRGVSPQH